MYETTFHLQRRPFAAAPLIDRHFPAAAIEQALATLARGIERAEGPGLLVGNAGTGKTLVCHLLAQQFQDRFQVALLASAQLFSRRALFQNILFELGLPFRDLEEGELRLSLVDFLDLADGGSQGLLLLIDEAHTLPVRLLEEIRMFTNLVRGGQPRVSLVLAGAPALEERFTSPRLQSFQQRLAARCYLRPFGGEETRGYVQWQIADAGGESDRLFTESALKAIHAATGGIPRLINQLCDHALIMAVAGAQRRIDADGIEEAWADLQQLPAPFCDASQAGESGIVEFGQLQDEEGSSEAEFERTGPRSQHLASSPVDPGARLDEIEELLGQSQRVVVTPAADSSRHFEGDQFHPEARPEVELVFDDLPHPFGHDFEEEEVVIDRYASLESVARRGHTRVTSVEGRQIASALSVVSPQQAAAEPAPEPESSPAAEAPQASPAHVETADVEVIDPASDPVFPEEGMRIVADIRPSERRSAAAIAAAARQQHQERQTNLRVAMTDDRDAIVIDDPRHDAEAEVVHPLGKVRRQEYRQLFAKLRRG